MSMHPTYEALAPSLGFQKMRNAPLFIYCMYLALDRFLALEIVSDTPEKAIAQ